MVRRIAVFLLAASVAYVFFINLCDFMFHCGCQSLWAGAAAMCNINMPDLPHCPFCSTGWWGASFPKWVMWSAQAAIAFPPWKMGDGTRLLLSLASFPVVGGVIGLIIALSTGYPTFLFFHLN